MRAMKVLPISLVLGMLMGGCAGRAPAPVAMTQVQDSSASCAAMWAEIKGNNEKIADLRSEHVGKLVQNGVAGFVGAFLWPVWFAMDFQAAAEKESNALEERNLYLAKLANERCPSGA